MTNIPEKFETIADDTIISIEISGTFYKRLQALFMHMSQNKNPQEFFIHYAKLAKGEEPSNEYEFNLYTIIALIAEIEKVAKKDGKTTMVDIPQNVREEMEKVQLSDKDASKT